jgi:spermidine synthase
MIFSNDQRREGYDAVLLGQVEPSKIDLDQLQNLLSRSEYFPVSQSLEEVGFGNNNFLQNDSGRTVINLLSTFAGQAPDLKSWSKNAQINRDMNLRLQYLAGMYFNSYIGTKILDSILSYYQFPQNAIVGSENQIGMLKQALAESGRREK